MLQGVRRLKSASQLIIYGRFLFLGLGRYIYRILYTADTADWALVDYADADWGDHY